MMISLTLHITSVTCLAPLLLESVDSKLYFYFVFLNFPDVKMMRHIQFRIFLGESLLVQSLSRFVEIKKKIMQFQRLNRFTSTKMCFWLMFFSKPKKIMKKNHLLDVGSAKAIVTGDKA